MLLPAATLLICLLAAMRERSILRPFLRGAAIGAGGVLLALVLIQGLVWVGDYSTGRLTSRLETVAGASANPAGDASYRERAAQMSAAWRAFRSSPALGVGPGYTFEWRDYRGEPVSSFSIDTGLALPAKFGVAGVVARRGR